MDIITKCFAHANRLDEMGLRMAATTLRQAADRIRELEDEIKTWEYEYDHSIDIEDEVAAFTNTLPL